MTNQNLTTKEFSEAARFRLSVFAQIVMREEPALEDVFKCLDQLHNEKAGIYRDLLTHNNNEENKAFLLGQLKDVELELSEVNNHFNELIKHKNN